jgi:hypothetical protein
MNFHGTQMQDSSIILNKNLQLSALSGARLDTAGGIGIVTTPVLPPYNTGLPSNSGDRFTIIYIGSHIISQQR